MTHKKTQKKQPAKKTEDFPVVFYRSISKEKLVEKKQNKKNPEKEKLVWMWAGIVVIMIALIGFWAWSLPGRLKLAGSGTDKIFSQARNDLAAVFEKNQATLDKLTASASLYQKLSQALSAPTNSTSGTPELTAEQIEKLKNEINK